MLNIKIINPVFLIIICISLMFANTDIFAQQPVKQVQQNQNINNSNINNNKPKKQPIQVNPNTQKNKPNVKINPQKQQKNPEQSTPKFPDSYSPLDKNKTVKIITQELIESTIETARQKYIKGLICVQRSDTVEAVKLFEDALNGLNKLVSYPEIENNEDFQDLSKNIIADYEKYAAIIDVNTENTLNMYISKERLFEENVVSKEPKVITSNNPKKTSTKNDKFVFKLPDTTELMIPLVDNPAVEKQINFLTTGRGRQFITGWLKRSRRWYNMITELARTEGMPEEIIVLPMIESAYNPTSVSPKSAVGLWQFMYPTGLDYGLNKRESIWVDERRDPIKSTRAGLRYLRDMYVEFNDWHLTLVAYNWGWGNVRRALKQTNLEKPTYWDLRTKKNIAMPNESQNYVPLFLALVKILTNPTEYGFDLESIEYEPEFLYDVIEIKQATNLAAIASAIGVGIQEIRDLNTELLYDITPPDRKYYRLRVPLGTAEHFIENFDKLPLEEKQPYLTHKVCKGEDVISISEKYDVAIDELITLNNLNGKNISLPNDLELRIPIGGKNYMQSTLIYTTDGLKPKTEVVSNNPNYHVVGTGESIYSVAAKYKISTANIRNWNKLPIDEEILKEGTTIIISQQEAERLGVLSKNGSSSKNSIEEQVKDNNKSSILNDNKSNQNNTVKEKNTASNKKTETSSKSTVKNNKTYTVQKGDNLSKIAVENNCTISELKKWNNLDDDKVIIGQVLNLNGNSSNTSTAANNTKTGNNTKSTPKQTSKETSKGTYTIKEGDNLSKIAAENNCSISDLKKWNNLDGDKVIVGQVLNLDNSNSANKSNSKNTQTTSKKSSKKSGVVYTVKDGDNLSKIAKKYNVSVNDIIKKNGNLNADKLKIGQKITIK